MALTLCFEPDAPLAKLRRKLDAWGRRLRVLVARAGSARERLQALTTFLADDLGFRGNAEEYYDPKNSLLSDVIETRRGIPISLAMLYVIVGRRANMQIDGINLPGHFIARYERILFDPVSPGANSVAAGLRGDPRPATVENGVEVFRTGLVAARLDADAGQSALHFRAHRREAKAQARHELAQGTGSGLGTSWIRPFPRAVQRGLAGPNRPSEKSNFSAAGEEKFFPAWRRRGFSRS